MAGKKKAQGEQQGSGDDDDKRTRQTCDYVFEWHKTDGTVEPVGLVLHTPSAVEQVKQWLDSRDILTELGFANGSLKVCKKIYS